MYYCMNCKNEFEEPKIEKTTYEEFYGVENEFAEHHSMNLEVCPYCGADEFEEMTTCDRCGEYCHETYLVDTEETIGIGIVCPDCANDCEV